MRRICVKDARSIPQVCRVGGVVFHNIAKIFLVDTGLYFADRPIGNISNEFKTAS